MLLQLILQGDSITMLHLSLCCTSSSCCTHHHYAASHHASPSWLYPSIYCCTILSCALHYATPKYMLQYLIILMLQYDIILMRQYLIILLLYAFSLLLYAHHNHVVPLLIQCPATLIYTMVHHHMLHCTSCYELLLVCALCCTVQHVLIAAPMCTIHPAMLLQVCIGWGLTASKHWPNTLHNQRCNTVVPG